MISEEDLKLMERGLTQDQQKKAIKNPVGYLGMLQIRIGSLLRERDQLVAIVEEARKYKLLSFEFEELYKAWREGE